MKIDSLFLDSGQCDNYSLFEVGLKLTHDEKYFINRNLQHLEALSPFGSTIKLNFTKIGNKVKGDISIISIRSKFRSHAIGIRAKEVYLSLENDIKQQLSIWKESRFNNNESNSYRAKLNHKGNGDCNI